MSSIQIDRARSPKHASFSVISHNQATFLSLFVVVTFNHVTYNEMATQNNLRTHKGKKVFLGEKKSDL